LRKFLSLYKLVGFTWRAITKIMNCHDAGPHTALDGDLLAQFLYLPATLQQQLVSAMLAHQALKQASEGTQAGQQPLVSLPILIWALEGTLPIC